MIQQMGSLKDLVEKIPGIGGMMPPGVNLDDKELVRIQAMIQSMTRQEKADPHVLIREPGRVKRIAKRLRAAGARRLPSSSRSSCS